ncbi:MAG: DegT/DnrJ/EryC1/StrS family aminotransferase, partial [Alphaproteobacteria bacterium]
DLPRGSEILFSALNIKGMIRIVEKQGFVPVPIDLDLERMAPRLDLVERAIGPNTRAIVVAHLFGTRLDLDAVVDLAHRKGLVVFEDCAQAFDGQAYKGHPRSDVVMFSFGPLKTATALGGAILRVRDAGLRNRMRAIQDAYPVPARGHYAKRVLKFMALKFVLLPPVFGALFRVCHLLGRDYEDPVSDAVRNVASLGSAKKIRKRMPGPMLAVLERRLTRWREGSLDGFARMGESLKRKIGDAVVLPASANRIHNYWVFPILTEEPMRLIRALRAAGFDGANLPRSKTVAAPSGRPDLEPETAKDALDHLVVLPCYPGMTEADLERQAKIVREVARPHRPTQALAAE